MTPEQPDIAVPTTAEGEQCLDVVRLERAAATRGDLPSVCICCGEKAEHYYASRIGEGIMSAELKVPLCEAHRPRSVRGTPLARLLLVGAVLGGLVLIAGLVTAGVAAWDRDGSERLEAAGGLMFFLGTFALIPCGLGYLLLCLNDLYPVSLRGIWIPGQDETWIALAGVAPEFAKAHWLIQATKEPAPAPPSMLVQGSMADGSDERIATTILPAPLSLPIQESEADGSDERIATTILPALLSLPVQGSEELKKAVLPLPPMEELRRCLQAAEEAAHLLGHDHLGSEHLLLGLRAALPSVAGHVLDTLGLDLERLRAHVREVCEDSAEPAAVEKLPVTPLVQRILNYAVEEAHKLHHTHLDTGHVLLGLLREPESLAVQILLDLGHNPETVRKRLLESPWSASTHYTAARSQIQ